MGLAIDKRITNGSFRLLNVQNASFVNSVFSDVDFACCGIGSIQHGAVYAVNTSLLVEDCTFRDNSAFESGGISSVNSNITIDHSTFYNNTGDGGFRPWNRKPGRSGGAIAMRETGNNISTFLNVAYSRFYDNRVIGSAGGAIYIDQCDTVHLLNNSFANNSARLTGGAITMTVSKELQVDQCTFVNNTSQYEGGAVFVKTDRAGLPSSYATYYMIQQNYFSDNVGDSGGGLYLFIDGKSVVNVNESHFVKNNEGGLYILIQSSWHSAVSVDQSSFIGNGGKGLSISINSVVNTSATVSRSEFVRNFNKNALSMSGQRLMVMNCTFTDNLGGVFMNGENNTVLQTNFFNNRGTVVHYKATRGGNLDIAECNFENNSASRCSAVFVEALIPVTISDSTFSRNRAVGYPTPGLGGVVCTFTCTSVSIHNSTFLHNSASSSGGVIYTFSSGCNYNVSSSIFDGNSAHDDGGVMFEDSRRPTIYEFSRCTFSNNLAGSRGGVLAIGAERDGPTAKFSECSFSYNNATKGGVMHTETSTIEIDKSVTQHFSHGRRIGHQSL